jgi:hypothetical protein
MHAKILVQTKNNKYILKTCKQVYAFFFFFFFFTCPHNGRGEIQTSDLRFMRRGPSQLSYSLGTCVMLLNLKRKKKKKQNRSLIMICIPRS